MSTLLIFAALLYCLIGIVVGFKKNIVTMMSSNEDRKLATIRRINKIKSIPGADRIVYCEIDGWNAVVQKGQFEEGEIVVYVEIDSWVPVQLAPFLQKKGVKKYFNGVEGERLRTKKLVGQLSQGLVLDLKMQHISECLASLGPPPLDALLDRDISALLGIQKWEREVLSTNIQISEGFEFPTFLLKTNQPRVQNMLKDLKVWTAPSLDKSKQFTFEVSEKLDGTSLTAFVCNGDEGICSRNLRVPLHPEPGEPDNVYSHLARRDDLIGKLRSLNRNIAAQGELLGPSIQENKYNLTDTRFYCFDLYDIDRARYIDPAARRQLCQQIGLTTIPLVDEDRLLGATDSMESLLKEAEGPSTLNPATEREGLVFRANLDRRVNFKCISNKFLLKYDEYLSELVSMLDRCG